MEAIFLAIVLLGVLGWWLSRRRRRLPWRAPWKLRRRSAQGARAESVPPRLMQNLHRLTRDRRVSERLIERIAFNNPGRSRRWCVEKAIYDLQRDRRS